MRAVGTQHPPRGGARHVAAVGAGHRLQEFHTAAWAGQPGPDTDLPDRDGTQDLAGEPGDDHVAAGLAALDRPAEERARRAAVLGPRVPRPGGMGCCQPRVLPGGDIEAVGHGWMLPAVFFPPRHRRFHLLFPPSGDARRIASPYRPAKTGRTGAERNGIIVSTTAAPTASVADITQPRRVTV